MILCYLVTLCCLTKSIIRLFEFFNHFSPYIHKQKNLCNLKINFAAETIRTDNSRWLNVCLMTKEQRPYGMLKKGPRSLAKRIKRCPQLQEMLENWPKSKFIASLEIGTLHIYYF